MLELKFCDQRVEFLSTKSKGIFKVDFMLCATHN